MTNIVNFSTLAEIEDEAATWLWRLDSETKSAADQEAFETWLRRDPRHRSAFEQFQRVWRQLDDLGGLEQEESRVAVVVPPEYRRRLHRLPWVKGLAAAALVVVATVLSVGRGPTSEAFATAVGQQRTVTLSDESVVTLNTNSILDTHFTADLREVHLRKGEAHFSVSHDRARPFVVHAGMSAVRAVGTAFDVRIIDSDHVDVIVTDGRVEVQATVPPTNGTVASPPGHTISAMSILEAGSRLRIDTQGVVVQAISGDVQSKSLAWRQGIVVFDGQRLSETIAELSRYTSMNIVVTDPRIADLPVGGRFRISEIDDFFAALEKAFPVVVRHVNDNLVYIEPRS